MTEAEMRDAAEKVLAAVKSIDPTANLEDFTAPEPPTILLEIDGETFALEISPV